MYPKSENVFKVIRNFEKIPGSIRESVYHVQMIESKVKPFMGSCGTQLCHAGWYASVTIKTLFDSIHFTDGGNKMAKHLGFKIMSDLIDWADKNPEIWGNKFGGSMFSDSKAFTGLHGKRISVNDIINHWKGVYERVLALEKTNEPIPIYKDITKELAILPIEEKADQPIKELVN